MVRCNAQGTVNAPRVSILLPFHNASAHLDAAIASMVEGSYTDHELILIDNASTDHSASIAAAWAGRDLRIRLVNEPIRSIARALNTGLGHARGNYIARMDADDISYPERLAAQVFYLDAHPTIGVLGTRTAFATTVQQSEGMRTFVEWQNSILTPHEHYVKRFVDAPLAHPSVMFRRELIDLHGGYSTEPLPEDHELWLRWMDAGVRFAKLPETFVQWNDHPHRLSRTHANYSVGAFYTSKMQWLARWLHRELPGKSLIVAGTSALCVGRAKQLEAEGVVIMGFTDVKRRELKGYRFIPHLELPTAGGSFVVSFISQRGTGRRIAEFLSSRGLTEGEDFILAA